MATMKLKPGVVTGTALQELFAYADSTTEETTEEDEVGRMHGDLLDLEPVVRDAVVLPLPTNPVCRPDCPGLCPGCGAHLADLPADHSHEDVDPRWAALTSLAELSASGSAVPQVTPAELSESGSAAPQGTPSVEPPQAAEPQLKQHRIEE